MDWHLDGPSGPMDIPAVTPDEAVEKYGQLNQLEDYELGEVTVTPAKALA